MHNKEQVFEKTTAMLNHLGLTAVKIDDSHPWGGFYVIDESQAAKFAAYLFF